MLWGVIGGDEGANAVDDGQRRLGGFGWLTVHVCNTFLYSMACSDCHTAENNDSSKVYHSGSRMVMGMERFAYSPDADKSIDISAD